MLNKIAMKSLKILLVVIALIFVVTHTNTALTIVGILTFGFIILGLISNATGKTSKNFKGNVIKLNIPHEESSHSRSSDLPSISWESDKEYVPDVSMYRDKNGNYYNNNKMPVPAPVQVKGSKNEKTNS